MGTFEFLMLIIVAISVLLVLIVLSQNPKGGGLSSSFGGAGGGQMFGVDRTNKFLDNATWTLATVIATLVIVASATKSNPKITTPEVEAKPQIEESAEPSSNNLTPNQGSTKPSAK